MFYIRKKIKFEASHRLISSFSKCCQKLHGHSYVVELFFKSKTLNKDGMVIDFGEVKEKINDIIDRFDHSLILDRRDNINIKLRKQKIFKIKYPTAEGMAYFFYKKIKPRINKLYKVRVHETDTGWAEYDESE